MVTINIIRKKKRNVNIYLNGILIFCGKVKKICAKLFFFIRMKFSLSENEYFQKEIDLTGKCKGKIRENILIQYAQFKGVLSEEVFFCKNFVKNYPNIILKLSTQGMTKICRKIVENRVLHKVIHIIHIKCGGLCGLFWVKKRTDVLCRNNKFLILSKN